MGDDWIDEARRKRIRFRSLLSGKDLVVMPGGFSPVYARMAEEIGFDCFFLAGSQMSGFLLGVPDAGILGLRDIVDHARHAAAHTSIPLLLDADTGFGNAVNAHYSVQEIVRSGVAGLNIEDQEAPKRSPTGAAAAASRKTRRLENPCRRRARNAIDPSFVIVARCDSIGVEPDIRKRSRAVPPMQKLGPIWCGSTQSKPAISLRKSVQRHPHLCSATGSARSSQRQAWKNSERWVRGSRSTR